MEAELAALDAELDKLRVGVGSYGGAREEYWRVLDKRSRLKHRLDTPDYFEHLLDMAEEA